jgi:hypothetical protein
VYVVTGDVTAGPASTPERLRGVQVRFTTRARAPDRDVDLPAGTDGRKNRFLLNQSDPIGQWRYARLRTLYADVGLPNLTGVQW